LGVDPAFRRRGIAARLLAAYERGCIGEPLFVSTNESNHPMHELLNRSGYQRSGSVDNLDPGDPEVFYFKSSTRC
jgi:ribosomal protein S18 acetylase RimI-like enzyme